MAYRWARNRLLAMRGSPASSADAPADRPLTVQEITLAIWRIAKGFTEHITAETGREREPQLVR